MKNRIIILFISLVFISFNLYAQKLTLGAIYPAGGKKGSSVEIEIYGLNLQDATSVIISGDGVKGKIVPRKESLEGKKKKKQKLNDQSAPQLADRINVLVDIDSKATPGLRDLRLQSKKGISNKLYFEVGQYQNVLENKKSPDGETFVPSLPATLCGQIMAGEIDKFSFNASKGMNLVISVKGRSLVPYIADAVPGWFQPIIRLTDEDGKEVAYDDDYRTSVDPVIITKIAKNGKYTLSINDAIYRGREDFNYRIDVGEIPFVSSIFPTVGIEGKKNKLEIDGVNLKSNKINCKINQEGYSYVTTQGKNGLISNPISFYSLKKGESLSYYKGINDVLKVGDNAFGYIKQNYQSQRYIIPASKNSDIALVMIARRNGSLIDGKMRLFNPQGKLVAESDDVEDASQGLMTFHADPQISYKAEESGDYYLDVEDVLGHSGKDYNYLISRLKKINSFDAFVSPANLTIPRGGTASFNVEIINKEKKRSKFSISVDGLPKGYELSNLIPSLGGKSWEVSVTAPIDAKEETIDLKVFVNEKMNNEKSVSVRALPTDDMMQAFYYIHHIPAASFSAEIIKPAPFSIEIADGVIDKDSKTLTCDRNQDIISIPIKIIRRDDFNEPIEIMLSKKLKQISLDPIEIQPSESDKVLQIKVDRNLLKNRRFRFPMNIVGTVKGKVEKNGKRSFQNAKYRELSPGFVIEVTAPTRKKI